MEVAGPPGTQLGLAQWKRASSRVEAGTSGFLSVSDSDRRVPAELGQESQASSCLRKGSPLASGVAQGAEIKLSTSAGSWKKQDSSRKNMYFCFIDYAKAFECMDHNKLWKILKEMGVPDHLTCLLRNLYAGQEATVNWTWKNTLVPNRKGSASRLYMVTLAVEGASLTLRIYLRVKENLEKKSFYRGFSKPD